MTTVQWANETRAAAAHPEHPWDKRALDWSLTPDSVVVEVGGYKGRWALQIAERYHPRLFVFEPQPWAAETCAEVLGDRATVSPYALGDRDGPIFLTRFGTDGCAVADAGEPAQMHEIKGAFAELGIVAVDLMLVNIEGYEYTLIPHMLAQGIRPKTLMVQLHPLTDKTLALPGYRKLWGYGNVLQAWRRR